MTCLRDLVQALTADDDGRGPGQGRPYPGPVETLFAIDARDGANRPGLSAAEQRAHDLTAGWMAEAGLAVSVDGAGNPDRPRGRHRPALPRSGPARTLDTVPNGGGSTARLA